jgi:hypothetical protein
MQAEPEFYQGSRESTSAYELLGPRSMTAPLPRVFGTAEADVGGAEAGWRQDNRHTLVTEPAESGAGNEVIMSIAHVGMCYHPS